MVDLRDKTYGVLIAFIKGMLGQKNKLDAGVDEPLNSSSVFIEGNFYRMSFFLLVCCVQIDTMGVPKRD